MRCVGLGASMGQGPRKEQTHSIATLLLALVFAHRVFAHRSLRIASRASRGYATVRGYAMAARGAGRQAGYDAARGVVIGKPKIKLHYLEEASHATRDACQAQY